MSTCLQASGKDNSSAVRAMGLDGYAMIWSVSVVRIDVRGVHHEIDTTSLAGSSWRQLPGRNRYNGTARLPLTMVWCPSFATPAGLASWSTSAGLGRAQARGRIGLLRRRMLASKWGTAWAQVGMRAHDDGWWSVAGTDAEFEWTPRRGQEGSIYQICFHMQVA